MISIVKVCSVCARAIRTSDLVNKQIGTGYHDYAIRRKALKTNIIHMIDPVNLPTLITGLDNRARRSEDRQAVD
jgi:hypothetical protein